MIAMGETRDGRSDYTNFEMDLLDTRMMNSGPLGVTKKKKKTGPFRNSLIKPSCFPITIFIVFVIMVVLLPVISPDFYEEETPDWEKNGVCKADCIAVLVESIPQGVTFPSQRFIGLETFVAWTNLLNISRSKIDLTAFYWTLRGQDVYKDPSAWQGEAVYELLRKVGKTKKIRIAQNLGNESQLTDSADLAAENLAEVRSLNFTHWFGGGVLHTKLWTIDDTHFYIGSANMDWRSLTQVKELGLVLYNCTCLAKEAKKIFDILWEMGSSPNTQIPWKWHFKYATKFNGSKPLQVYLNGTLSEVYLASSPPAFCPKGRNTDLSAIKLVIKSARQLVYVAVMDYAASYLYSPKKTYWPDIDDELKRAAFDNNVDVRLLISSWNHSSPYMCGYLKSLQAFSSSCRKGKISVKLFSVPSDAQQAKIPFARVNHNKYMVTENTAYIGTSNWSGDYFNSTAGASIVITQNTTTTNGSVVKRLQDIFLRDWESQYAKPLIVQDNVKC